MKPEQISPDAGRLERFRLAKQGELKRLERLAREGALPAPYSGKRPSFRAALSARAGRLPAVVAEYKRASPSRGAIALHLEPEEVARQYAEAGAACLSVLTEETFFQGAPAFLSRMAEVGRPLLRKDFLFDPLQVIQTAALPASALLLIVRLTPDPDLLRRLRKQAESFGLEAIVEVFDADDLACARASGASLIQVNARDLETFSVDRTACLQLADRHRGDREGKGELWIAASGMKTTAHLVEARTHGYDAVLMGTALMEGGHPGSALRNILTP